MEKKVCVIVPFRKISLKFKKCIESILDLNYSNFEVILVNDGNESIQESFLKDLEDKVRILNSYKKGPSFARNLAAKNTCAEFLAFTDSDCIVSKDWLKELLKGIESFPEVVGCGGKQEIPEDATPFEKKIFLFMKKVSFITDYIKKGTHKKLIETHHNPSCNVMYKRDVFLKEGGFLEGLWPGEDVELDYRLRKKGYKLIFNPKAVVYHYRPQSLKDFLKMMYRYGRSAGFLTKKYGFFRKIQIIPLISLFFLILFFLSIIFNFVLFFIILCSIILFSLLIYFKFDFTLFLLAFLSYIFWNCGFFKEIFLIKRRF